MSQTTNTAHAGKAVLIKQLVFSAMAVALAMVTSNIKFLHLPQGGSITLFSMLFICLIGYWYGPKWGILTGIAYGILQFTIDPFMLSVPQVLLDYPLAFGALGLSGFFSKQKYGLWIGYFAGIFGRFVISVISGVVFFASFAPKGMNPLVYSIAYNGIVIGTEGLLTLIVISVPPVTKALKYVRLQAEGARR